MKKILLKTNKPLQIIALMIGMSEIGLGLVARNTNLAASVVWAMILLPFIVVILFFYVLIYKPNNLYSPSDFSDQKDFLRLQGKVKDIESNPFIMFSKLEEPAIRLFLAAYYTHTNDDNNTKWQALIGQFGKDNIEKARTKLVELNWLSDIEKPFSKTKEGQEAHDILKEFVYGRMG